MWNLSFRLAHKNLYAFLISTCATCPTHLVSSQLYYRNGIEWAVWARNSHSLYNFHQFHSPSSYAQVSVSTLFSSSSAYILPFMLRVQTSHLCEAPVNLRPYLVIDEYQGFWVSTGNDGSKEILQHQAYLYKYVPAESYITCWIVGRFTSLQGPNIFV